MVEEKGNFINTIQRRKTNCIVNKLVWPAL